MTLHTINKNGSCLARCLGVVHKGDAVLLIEDGVYAAVPGTDAAACWQSLPVGVSCLALTDDLLARGLTNNLLPLFRKASWQDFVDLSVNHDKIINWG